MLCFVNFGGFITVHNYNLYYYSAFLIKFHGIKFNSPTMTYSFELPKHNNDVKAQIRKLENINYKKLKCKWSQIFNQACLKDF